jgi:hypothetical protein
MLWTICVILFVLWLLGLVSGYTMGGIIHERLASVWRTDLFSSAVGPACAILG